MTDPRRPPLPPLADALPGLPEDTQPGPATGLGLRIGVFDSGVGGLSVLQAIRSRLPHAEMIYAADTGHAPYGDRSEDHVCDRARRIAGFLHEQGAGLLVVACNTATAAAVATLRAQWPALPIVGVEPGIKPAVALSRAGRIGVLATTATLASEKFRRLAQAHAGNAVLVLQACPGLATAIEAEDVDGAALDALVARHAVPLRDAGVDVAVLGCTHYVFARERFERELPGVHLLDTGDAVARQTARLAAGLAASASALASTSASTTPVVARLCAYSSGEPGVLSRFARRWLGVDLHVQPMRA